MAAISKDRNLVNEAAVFALTPKGESELRGAETSLSPPELELLVLIDGKSTVAEIGATARSRPAGAINAAFWKFFQDGLIASPVQSVSDSLDFTKFLDTSVTQPTRKAMTAAKKEATAGTTTLQTQGYYVRIARRAGVERKLPEGQALSVIVIEDEPNLAKFLKQYLALERFDARIAGNRAEIVTELLKLPPPDLVLLDVMLPDVDGFDVLLKMRTHPALKAVPVIMLTAKATREAVLKGLARGADGYITKPFEAEVLVKAVKAVLGISEEEKDAGSSRDSWKIHQDK